MATPPTIGAAVAGSPASSIASAKAVTANTLPGNPATVMSSNFNYLGTATQILSAYYFVNPLAPTGVSTNYSVEGDFYGLKFEYGYQGVGNIKTRVWVDGQPAEATYTADATQDGAIHLRPVTFATVGWHRIKIDIATAFWGVNIGPTDTWIPTPAETSRLLVIGDSYGGSTGSNGVDGYAQSLGVMLGYSSTYSLSVGGTGLLTPGAYSTYRNRAADWPAVNATAVLIQMSINDDGQTAAAIATELALLVPIVKALPTVKDVWIMGTCAKGGGNVGTKQPREAILAAAAATLGVPYINLVSPAPLWSGTGYTGATTGSGNSDIMMYGDNAHPTKSGHDMIARAVAAGIIASRSTM